MICKVVSAVAAQSLYSQILNHENSNHTAILGVMLISCDRDKGECIEELL